MALPQYTVERTLGEAHQQTFEVACFVEALQARSVGSGTSRRTAEQAAAEVLLARLLAQDPADTKKRPTPTKTTIESPPYE